MTEREATLEGALRGCVSILIVIGSYLDAEQGSSDLVDDITIAIKDAEDALGEPACANGACVREP